MHEEVRTYQDVQVLITTDWTKRKVTITGEHNKRYVTLTRALGDASWSISFACKLGTSRRPKDIKLTLSNLSPDFNNLVDRAVRFVAVNELLTDIDFKRYAELTASQESFLLSIAKEVKRKAGQPKLGT